MTSSPCTNFSHKPLFTQLKKVRSDWFQSYTVEQNAVFCAHVHSLVTLDTLMFFDQHFFLVSMLHLVEDTPCQCFNSVLIYSSLYNESVKMREHMHLIGSLE